MKKEKRIFWKKTCGIVLSLMLISSMTMTALAGDVAVQDWYSDAVETEGTDGLPMQSGEAERESESEMEVETEIETETVPGTERHDESVTGEMESISLDTQADTSTELQTRRTALADSNFGLNWKYKVNDSDQTVRLIRYIGDDTDVVVPANVNIEGKEYSILVDTSGASLGEFDFSGAFDRNEKITSVRFMAGSRVELNSMEYAFVDCLNLRSVSDIPENVSNMSNAFVKCSSLTTAPKIPKSVTNMDLTFGNCSSLITAPEIPQSVTSMEGTFGYCSSLTIAPEIPLSVTSMHSTFFGCSSLISAPEIPLSVVSMVNTFSGCSSLITASEIPQSVNNMDGTFGGCSSLTTAPKIPPSVADMRYTFSGCSSLIIAPEIPPSVVDMSYTFSDCSSLTIAPEIPRSVNNMSGAFSGCSSLTTAPKIPPSVANMDYTFAECSSLTIVPEVPVGVINMSCTFFRCSSLTTAPKIPQSVRNMDRTFSKCSSLRTTPEILQGVTNMRGTFTDCSSLTTVQEIPQSVTNMGGTFSGCSSLKTVPEIPQGVYNVLETFSGCSSLTTAPEIPQSVNNMRGTFSGCSSLTTAPEISQSVTSIVNTFSGCSSLTTAPEIPQSVNNMRGTFSRCSSLTGQITIKMDTRNVSSDSFDECFYDAATSDEGLVVNYSENCTKIDEIIATKGDESNITKGKNIDLAGIQKYKVSFDCGGGAVSPLNVTVTYGSIYGTLPTPTRQHYKFLGWYTSESGGTQITSSSKVEIGKDHTLYARWSGEAYNVAFDAAGGNLNVKIKTAIYGEAYGALPTPTRQYYEFLGWYTSKSGGSRVTADTRVLTGGSHALYARWIGKAYKVSYNANGGKYSPKSKLVNYGSAYGQLPAPVRKGYKFKGWHPSKKGGKKVTSATSFTTAKDIALYARWDKISVKKAVLIQLKNKKSKQMTGTIKRVKGVKGYQIVYGLNKSVTKGKKSLLSTSAKFTINKLKKGRTYYVKARGYAVDSAGKKVYGRYCAVKSLKIKK